jgi:hypothetical protein
MFDLFKWFCRYFRCKWCSCICGDEYTVIDYENTGNISSDEEQEVIDRLLGGYQESSVYSSNYSDPETINDSDSVISNIPELEMTMYFQYSERDNSVIINSYRDDPIERIPAPSPGTQQFGHT